MRPSEAGWRGSVFFRGREQDYICWLKARRGIPESQEQFCLCYYIWGVYIHICLNGQELDKYGRATIQKLILALTSCLFSLV